MKVVTPAIVSRASVVPLSSKRSQRPAAERRRVVASSTIETLLSPRDGEEGRC